MPKRSTPFQSIVRLVRKHFALPGVTVTESKILRDVHGQEHEVDVVIEGEFDGEPMVISVEVVERSRVIGREWVYGMLRKHRDLPTNRLLLVSKSGFSRPAVEVIEREGSWVGALAPEVIKVDGHEVVNRLHVDAIDYNPTSCKVHVRLDGDEQIVVEGTPLTDVYSEDGTLLGPLAYLVQDMVGLDEVRRQLSIEAHKHPEKDQVTAFSIGVLISRLGYHLLRIETGTLHLIEALVVWGPFSVSQTEVPLTLAKLGERTYGAAQVVSFAGRPTVWVGTTDLGGADHHDLVAGDGLTESHATACTVPADPLSRPPHPVARGATQKCRRSAPGNRLTQRTRWLPLDPPAAGSTLCWPPLAAVAPVFEMLRVDLDLMLSVDPTDRDGEVVGAPTGQARPALPLSFG